MIPKRFDDGFRAWIALLVTLPLIALAFLLPVTGGFVGDDPARLIVILTAAGSWVLMAYSFALRYFRLHAAGESITFGIAEPPEFEDFVTMALLISATGSHSGGTPTTRAGLRAVRAHSIIAFVFNALVIAMIVSLMTGFISQT